MNQENYDFLPRNIEAEEAILGSIILDPLALPRISDKLVPEAFTLFAHQTIYKAAIKLYQEGKPNDLLGVSTYLDNHKLLEKVGGIGRLGQLLNRTVSAVNVDRYAELVNDKYIRRRLIEAGHNIINLGHETSLKVDEVLEGCEQHLFKVTQNRVQEGIVPIDETLINVFNDIENICHSGELPGIKSGYYDLDGMTGGFTRSDIIILAARPSMGKTAMAMNIAINIAQNNYPVVFFSMEMSREQLAYRLISTVSGIPGSRIRLGRIAQNETERLIKAVESLSALPINIDDSVNMSVLQMKSKCKQFEMKTKKPIGLIIIDYLQLMGNSVNNRVQEIGNISRSLKCMARELNVPIIVLSQLSREVERRNNKRPVLSDLRDSGAIEQDADIVGMLYRDEYYRPDTPDRGLAELIIVKHRNGGLGTIKLRFNSATTSFFNLEKFR